MGPFKIPWQLLIILLFIKILLCLSSLKLLFCVIQMSIWRVVRSVAHAIFSYSNGNYKLSNVFERSGIASSYILKVVGSLKQRERQESKGSLSFLHIQLVSNRHRHWILNKGHPHYSRSVSSGNLLQDKKWSEICAYRLVL